MTKFANVQQCTLRNGDQVSAAQILLNVDMIAFINVADGSPYMVTLKPPYAQLCEDRRNPAITYDYWIGDAELYRLHPFNADATEA